MFNEYVSIFKALGNENRLRIFHLLCHRPLCVCELTAILNVSQATVSRHLMQLKNAGLIEDEKNIPWTQYKVAVGSSGPLPEKLVREITSITDLDRTLKSDFKASQTVDRRSLYKKGTTDEN